MQTISRHTENLSAVTNQGHTIQNLSAVTNQGHAIQNHGKGSLSSGGMAIIQRQKGPSAAEGVEKRGALSVGM